MSECPIDARNFLYHAQDRINSCWQEAERIGMSESLFDRLMHGFEETRLPLDYLEAAMRKTLAEDEVPEVEASANPEVPPVEAPVVEAAEPPAPGSA